jgi:hypothetical protein
MLSKEELRRKQLKKVLSHPKNQIVWVDELPPPVESAHRQYEELLKPFLERPNQWGRFRTYPAQQIDTARSSANRLNSGNVAIPPGKWEFAYRWVTDERKEVGLYAKYLGPGVMEKRVPRVNPRGNGGKFPAIDAKGVVSRELRKLTVKAFNITKAEGDTVHVRFIAKQDKTFPTSFMDGTNKFKVIYE